MMNINASIAKTISDEARNNIVKNAILEIESAIKSAAEKGEYSIEIDVSEFDFDILMLVKGELYNNGFSINDASSNYIIKW